jgi:hypothetical protein
VKLARRLRLVPCRSRDGAAGASPIARPGALPWACKAARSWTGRARVVRCIPLTLISGKPGTWSMPCCPRVPGGLRLAGRLSRHGAAGERTRRRPRNGPGHTRVPRMILLRSTLVPGSGLRAIGRRPVAGVSASRHRALLAADARAVAADARALAADARALASEAGAAEARSPEARASGAVTEARHAMRAWPGVMPAGEAGTPWRDS